MSDAMPNLQRPVALQLNNIHKNFGSLEVLKGVSLTAYDGDVISILGSSGSGKSTLLRCINLLENPSQGEVFLGSEALVLKPNKSGDLVAANQRQLEQFRSKMGFVFQNFNLWPHRTILQNIIEKNKYVLSLDSKENTYFKINIKL